MRLSSSSFLAAILTLTSPTGLASSEAGQEAAFSGARLAEELQGWEVAANLYRRLIVLAPGLRKTWENRLEKLPTTDASAEAPSE